MYRLEGRVCVPVCIRSYIYTGSNPNSNTLRVSKKACLGSVAYVHSHRVQCHNENKMNGNEYESSCFTWTEVC